MICSGSFLLYDYAVKQRQATLVLSAEKTSSVISNLFPQSIQDRLLAQAEHQILSTKQEAAFFRSKNKKQGLKDHMEQEMSMHDTTGDHSTFDEPMADLFAEVSIWLSA